MSLPSSGSMTPRSTRHDVVGGGERVRWARPDSTGGSRVNSTGHGRATESTATAARAAQGARRQHPLRDLPRAGPLAAPAGHRRDRRHARPARQHRAPAPRAHARGRPARRASPTPRARSAGRSTATRSPPTRRRSASSRRRSRCSPGCCCALAATAGVAGRRRGRGRAASRAPPPPRPPGAAPAPRPLTAGAGRPRLRPRVGRRRRRRHRSPSPAARSASWPRPTPTSCAASTGGWSRGSSTPGATAQVVAFHDLVDRTPCQVEIATARR